MIGEVYTENGEKKVREISGAIPTGLPVGTWISFEKDQAPDNKWIKAGETFDENVYPALYLFLGTNEVPYRYDMNRLDPLTVVQLTANTDFVCQYDGIAVLCGSRNNALNVNLNGNNIVDSGGGNSDTWQISIPIHKGDVLLSNKTTESTWNVGVSYNTCLIAYAKHPLFIKATSAIEITDQNTFLNTVQSLVQSANSYSTEETATGGFWIDGKPIYGKIFSGTLTSGTSWIIQASLKSTIGADYITEMKAIANANNGTVSNNYWSSNTDYLKVLVDGSGNLVLAKGSSYPALPFTYSILVEYTKS